MMFPSTEVRELGHTIMMTVRMTQGLQTSPHLTLSVLHYSYRLDHFDALLSSFLPFCCSVDGAVDPSCSTSLGLKDSAGWY
jgi:hypothetical protein